MSEITAAQQYDSWFEQNEALFESELQAIEAQMPETFEKAVDVGCGTGIFSERLGISRGVEPSQPMAARARERGLSVEQGTAEDLPVETDAVELALTLGVLSYAEDADWAIAELGRVVEPGGDVVVAFLRDGSGFAELYEEAVSRGKYPPDLDWESPYPLEMARQADWLAPEEVFSSLRAADFEDLRTVQTLTRPPKQAVQSVEDPTEGHAEGSWVVVRGSRSA